MICWWSKTSGKEKKPGIVSKSLRQCMDGRQQYHLPASLKEDSSLHTVKLSVMEIVQCACSALYFQKFFLTWTCIKTKPNQYTFLTTSISLFSEISEGGREIWGGKGVVVGTGNMHNKADFRLCCCHKRKRGVLFRQVQNRPCPNFMKIMTPTFRFPRTREN